MNANKTKPAGAETALKILLLDIETSPIIGYTWTTWQTNVIKVIQPRQIFCVAWKWLHEREVRVKALPDYRGYKKDRSNNRSLMGEVHAVVSKADVIVGHNLRKFDDRRLNTDFFKHDFEPPPPHKIVDTLEFARHKFDFESNRLDYLAEFLGVGKKVKHWGFELWERCLAGDPVAWALMRRYNKRDVWPLLEKVYLKMRPWMTNHPNACAPDKLTGCRVCRSKNVIQRGYGVNAWGRYPRFKCKDCGKWHKGEIIEAKRVNGKLIGGRWRFK